MLVLFSPSQSPSCDDALVLGTGRHTEGGQVHVASASENLSPPVLLKHSQGHV